jgi:type IV pilus assembly protein PilA
MKAAINNLRLKRKDEGFTLVELLVVVVIIGVLVAIAIPMYGNYRKGAANKSAQSDVRGAITAVEQYYTENSNTYPTPATVTGGTGNAALQFAAQTNGTAGTATVSPGNEIGYATGTGTGGSAYYVLCAWNTDSKVLYGYNSAKGQSVHKSQTTTNTISGCLATEGANTP